MTKSPEPLTPEELKWTRKNLAQVQKEGHVALTLQAARRVTVNNDRYPGVRDDARLVSYDVELEGEGLAYGDWILVATWIRQSDSDAATVYRAMGHEDVEIDAKALESAECGYCGKVHSWRSRFYLLENTRTGEVAYVATHMCIGAFLGIDGDPRLTREDKIIARSTRHPGGDQSRFFDPIYIAGVVFALGEVVGYRPTLQKVDPLSTASQLRLYIKGTHPQDAEITASIPNEAETLRRIDRIKNMLENHPGRFSPLLRHFFEMDAITPWSFGSAAALIPAYRYSLRDNLPDQHDVPDRWIQVKPHEQIAVDGTVTFLREALGEPTQHGLPRVRVNIGTPYGTVSLATAAQWAWAVGLGDRVSLVGTVGEQTTVGKHRHRVTELYYPQLVSLTLASDKPLVAP